MLYESIQLFSTEFLSDFHIDDSPEDLIQWDEW